MSARLSVTSNIADFNVALRRMSLEMRAKSVRAATSAAAGAIVSALRADARARHSPKADQSRRTGTLEKAVYRFRNSRSSTAGAERLVVGIRTGKRFARKRDGQLVRKPDAFYGRFLEFGWTPRGPGNRLRGGRRAKALARERQSAGRVIYPFLAPSFTRSQARAVEIFQQRLSREVAKLDRVR